MVLKTGSDVSLQTIIFVIKENQVLLARKQDEEKFGGGKFNGYGGKLEQKESIENAAVRELREESNLIINVEDLRFVGIVRSSKDDNSERRERVVYVFTVDYENTSQNYKPTMEMIEPTWYNFSEIPYQNMWPDSKLWMPKIFEGFFVDAQFLYNSIGNLEREIVNVLQLPNNRKIHRKMGKIE